MGSRPKIVEKKECFGGLGINLVIGDHKGALWFINDRPLGMLKMKLRKQTSQSALNLMTKLQHQSLD